MMTKSFFFLLSAACISIAEGQAVRPDGDKMLSMTVNEAVMVTADLDYGGNPPSIAAALKDIERIYMPADNSGRTFAILDAYGEKMPDGKLHISMHVSSEKVGVGRLVFKKTGAVLWQSKILPDSSAEKIKQKKLKILISNGEKTYTVDGSNNPSSILNAILKETGQTVKEFWKDGAEKEITFFYSACGCPVKVQVKRAGEITKRTSLLPVIFPDDPAVVALIDKLMAW
jgi:hypothetical protein